MNKSQLLILESLLKEPEGLTRQEVNDMLASEGLKPLLRQAFAEFCKSIQNHLGVRIYAHNCGKNVWRYRIDRTALEDYDRQQLIGNLVTNMLQLEFLKEYRDLGSRIQPVIIARGAEYLRPIGTALRLGRKLAVTYQKFDEEPYPAILHPYCLKVSGGRWYLFAYKEHSEHIHARMQCFALDRFHSLSVTTDTFAPDVTIDPQEYFRDAYGVWVDPEHYPVRDVFVACTPKVANYLRSLPLHHSQTEVPAADTPLSLWERSYHLPCPEGRSPIFFRYHLSPTPDFLGELRKWGNEMLI